VSDCNDCYIFDAKLGWFGVVVIAVIIGGFASAASIGYSAGYSAGQRQAADGYWHYEYREVPSHREWVQRDHK
jgi:hypothetical protein